MERIALSPHLTRQEKQTNERTHGTPALPFSELFADTVRAHGVAWAWSYYTTRGRMAAWEFNFWLRATFGG